MGTVDNILVGQTDEVIFCIMLLLGILIVNLISMSFSIVVVIPVIALAIFIRQYYVKTSLSVRKNESMLRSPVLSHFSETINGRVAVHSFNLEHYMLDKLLQRQDDNGTAWFSVFELNILVYKCINYIPLLTYVIKQSLPRFR